MNKGTSLWISLARTLTASIFLLLTTMSGCGYFFSDGSLGQAGQAAVPLTVEKRYSLAGDANFLTYVSASDPSVVCPVGSITSYKDCIHAGEARLVTIPGVSSCGGLTLSDSQEAFEWDCLIQNGQATFVSRRFAENKGIGNVINADSTGVTPPTFKSMHVTLSGSTTGQSSDTVWWSNPLAYAPANSALVDTPLSLDGVDDDGAGPDDVYAAKSILVVPASRLTSGYNIGIDQLGIVVMPGVTLSYLDDGNNCNGTSEMGTPTNKCIIAAGAQNYAWIEGRIDATSLTGIAVSLTGMRMSRFQNVRVNSGGASQISLSPSGNTAIVMDSVQVLDGGSHGINMVSVTGSLFSRVSVTRNTSQGMNINTNNVSNVFKQIKATSNGAVGLNFSGTGSHYNVVQDLIATNNATLGLNIGSTNTALTTTRVIAAFNGTAGMQTSSTSVTQGIFHNILSLNNAFTGFSSGGNTNTTLSQMVVAYNGTTGFAHAGASAGSVQYGNILVSDNSDNCGSIAGTNFPISVGCASTSVGQVFSNTLTSAAANLTVGPLSVDDTQNQDDTNGSFASASVSDWARFENPLRLWGSGSGTNASSTAARGNLSGVIRIWDWSLKAASALLATSNASSQGAFVAGLACPAYLNGDMNVTTPSYTYNVTYHTGIKNVVNDNDSDGVCEGAESCQQRYHLYASEIFGDEIGDDDGLCESNEYCLANPNFGPYQGHGSFKDNECVFNSAGGLSGIRMFAYPTNGR